MPFHLFNGLIKNKLNLHQDHKIERLFYGIFSNYLKSHHSQQNNRKNHKYRYFYYYFHSSFIMVIAAE